MKVYRISKIFGAKKEAEKIIMLRYKKKIRITDITDKYIYFLISKEHYEQEIYINKERNECV